MYIPTFYLLKENYLENELERLIGLLTECGARVVIVQNGKQDDNLAKNLIHVACNHV